MAKTMSLKTRLVAMTMALGLVPLCAAAFTAVWLSSESLYDSQVRALESAADQAAGTYSRVLAERYGDVVAFAENPQARADPATASALQDQLTTLYGVYELMVLADASGKIIAVNSKDHEGKPMATAPLLGRSVKDAPWFQAAMDDKFKDGSAWHGDLEENSLFAAACNCRGLCLPFAAPVHDDKGQVQRVWLNIASYDRVLGSIADDIRQASAAGGTHLEFSVFQRDGTLVYDEDPKAVLSFNFANAGLQAGLDYKGGKNRGHTEEMHKRRKVPTLNAYAQMKSLGSFPGYDWGVMMRQDTAEFLAPAHAMRNYMLGFTAIVGALLALAALLFARSIVRPLESTVRVCDAMAAGDLTQRVDVVRDDEVGKVGAALNAALEERQRQDAETSRLVQLVRNAPMAILYADSELRIRYANPTAEQMFARIGAASGLPAGALEGASATDLRMGSSPGELRAILSDPKRLPWTADAALGAEHVHLVASAITDSSGAYLGPMLTCELTTEKVRLEAKQRKDHENLAGILKRVVAVSGSLQDAAARLGASSEQMSSAAVSSLDKTRSAAVTASDVSTNVQAVATATEEMSASVKDISRNVSEAVRSTHAAVEKASQTNTTVAKLGESSRDIGAVVKVIQTIAQQTNLLALNATIEAARAGEAGKGFAVVANEVKELAKGTARATEEIGGKIEAIQADTQRAVEAIGEISTAIDGINAVFSSIASAVEEQSATTGEISNNVHAAASRSSQIANDVGVVASAMEESKRSIDNTRAAAIDLRGLAQELEAAVGGQAAQAPRLELVAAE